MFSIRQVLRFGARLACVQRSNYYRCVPMCKPTDIVAFRRAFHENISNRKELGKLEEKMRLIFTCKKCQTRNSKLISKLAYNKGIIIVRCDGCKNNHLIADNLGWFTEIHNGVNIEKIMASKGETVRKIIDDTKGYYEVVTNEDFNLNHNSTNGTRKSDNENNHTTKTEKIEVSKKS